MVYKQVPCMFPNGLHNTPVKLTGRGYRSQIIHEDTEAYVDSITKYISS